MKSMLQYDIFPDIGLQGLIMFEVADDRKTLLNDGGGCSKMKVSFLVSSQSILKRLSQNFATIII